jgi:hypothetical protein
MTRDEMRVIRHARAEKMAESYRAGQTLQAIGNAHGISRERVRQLLEEIGIRASDGGMHARAAERRREQIEQVERACMRRWGVTRAEYKAIAAQYGSHNKYNHRSPFMRYTRQRENARKRGIAWNFTFADWWRIWQVSGKWDLMGRGFGYVMARKGDCGPYAPDNVYICTSSQNAKDSYIFKPSHLRRKPGPMAKAA